MRPLTPLCPGCGEDDTVGPLAEALPYLDDRSLLHLAPPGVVKRRPWLSWAAVPASAALGFIASTVVPPFEMPWSIIAPVAASATWATIDIKRKPPAGVRTAENAHRRWSRAWWCERDRGVFVPGETSVLSPEAFSRWVRAESAVPGREERRRAA